MSPAAALSALRPLGPLPVEQRRVLLAALRAEMLRRAGDAVAAAHADFGRRSEMDTLLADVLRQIDTIYGPLARRTPITRPRMKLKPTFAKVGVEMRAKLGHFDLAYLVGKWFYTVIGKLYFAFTSAGDHYLDRLVQLSDTLMIDGRINTIISGTAAQREALIAALGRFEKNGEIVFGMQICAASVMSCYVRDRRDQHIHFVDGLGGGYTQAATMLKRKMAGITPN